MIRPERIGVEPHGSPGENRLPGMVENVAFLGGTTELHVRVPGGALLRATVPNDGTRPAYEQGAPVALCLPAASLRVLAPPAGRAEPD
jgi:spermidine/putrescine transport system ATP-binding protein